MALHSWAVRVVCLVEETSGVWWERSGLHDQTGVMGNAEVKLLVVVEKGCGLMVREEYCLLTCVVESGTGVAAWVPDHVGNWVVCAQSQLGNWVHWSWGSCSAMNSLPLCADRQTDKTDKGRTVLVFRRGKAGLSPGMSQHCQLPQQWTRAYMETKPFPPHICSSQDWGGLKEIQRARPAGSREPRHFPISQGMVSVLQEALHT